MDTSATINETAFPSNSPSIVIVGGSIAGLVTALRLLRAGYPQNKIVVLERTQPGAIRQSGGLTLHEPTVLALEELGIPVQNLSVSAHTMRTVRPVGT